LNLLDPFPEEFLRRVTFNLAQYAICPNASAALRMREYRGCEVIDTTENTMLDCVRYAVEKGTKLHADETGTYFVASIHRFENIYRKSRLRRIVSDIIAVSKSGRVHFVLHPPTERQLRKCGLLERLSCVAAVQLTGRMPFTRFVALIAGARGIFSDGGSNQEELSYLGVPTVIFRERSERPDGFGANVILRQEAGQSLADFIRSGKLDALRRPSRLLTNVQPSQAAIEALHQWSVRGERTASERAAR
jgi:UDP-N-acetylglucosamine 2-epimerase (non-hydrolysing)